MKAKNVRCHESGSAGTSAMSADGAVIDYLEWSAWADGLYAAVFPAADQGLPPWAKCHRVVLAMQREIDELARDLALSSEVIRNLRDRGGDV